MAAHQAVQASLRRLRWSCLECGWPSPPGCQSRRRCPSSNWYERSFLRRPEPPGDGPRGDLHGSVAMGRGGGVWPRGRRSTPVGWRAIHPRSGSHPNVNLGFAVAVADGLIVPVIRDAASMSPEQISVQNDAGWRGRRAAGACVPETCPAGPSPSRTSAGPGWTSSSLC